MTEVVGPGRADQKTGDDGGGVCVEQDVHYYVVQPSLD